MVLPQTVHKPDVIVSGSRHIGSCDSLILNIGSTSGNIGKSLYHKWNVYFETQFLDSEEGTQYILSPAALQTFDVKLLRIELYSENWVCLIINICNLTCIFF